MSEKAKKIATRGFATELSATLEELLDIRSQYGRPSIDEPKLLKRCRYLADLLEQSFKSEDSADSSRSA